MPTLLASDGCRVTYDVSGKGEALLLIPGLGGAASFWNDIVPLLVDRYKVISFDHRGTGRSDRPVGKYSVPRIAQDAVESSATRRAALWHSSSLSTRRHW